MCIHIDLHIHVCICWSCRVRRCMCKFVGCRFAGFVWFVRIGKSVSRLVGCIVCRVCRLE